MKFVKVLASLLMVFMVCSAFSLKGNDKSKGMYIVGVSASFSDSLVYFTDIQYLDSVQVNKKTKLLPMRSNYSEQLDNFLEQVQGMKNRTCFIYFNEKKAKLEKVINKMKKEYMEGGKSILRETGSDFKFTRAVEY